MEFERFRDGIATIQAALQGEFQPGFVEYLWAQFQSLDETTWNTLVDLACRIDRPANRCVAADFFRCLSQARERIHLQGKATRAMNESSDDGPISFGKLLEMNEQSEIPWLRDIAQKARGKGQQA